MRSPSERSESRDPLACARGFVDGAALRGELCASRTGEGAYPPRDERDLRASEASRGIPFACARGFVDGAALRGELCASRTGEGAYPPRDERDLSVIQSERSESRDPLRLCQGIRR